RCTTINFSRDHLDVYYDFKSENELDKLYQFLTFDDCFWFFTFNLIFLWLGRCLMASSFYCIIWLSCLHRDVTHRQLKVYDTAYELISLINDMRHKMKILYRIFKTLTETNGIFTYIYRSVYVNHRSVGSELAEDVIRVATFTREDDTEEFLDNKLLENRREYELPRAIFQTDIKEHM